MDAKTEYQTILRVPERVEHGHQKLSQTDFARQYNRGGTKGFVPETRHIVTALSFVRIVFVVGTTLCAARADDTQKTFPPLVSASKKKKKKMDVIFGAGDFVLFGRDISQRFPTAE